MDINLTFFGEMITFGVLIFVTMKFIWPQIVKAMEERQEKIAAGLAAAERAQRDLELVQEQAVEKMREAAMQAKMITDKAHREVLGLIESGKHAARKEGSKILSHAHETSEKERRIFEQELKKNAEELAREVADKILHEKVDAEFDKRLIDQFIREVEN